MSSEISDSLSKSGIFKMSVQYALGHGIQWKNEVLQPNSLRGFKSYTKERTTKHQKRKGWSSGTPQHGPKSGDVQLASESVVSDTVKSSGHSQQGENYHMPSSHTHRRVPRK